MTMTREAAIAAVVDPKAHADPPRLDAAFPWLREHAPVARAGGTPTARR